MVKTSHFCWLGFTAEEVGLYSLIAFCRFGGKLNEAHHSNVPKGVEEGRNLVDSEVSYAILCLYFDYELLILLLVELFGLVSCVFHRYDIWLDSNGTLLE